MPTLSGTLLTSTSFTDTDYLFTNLYFHFNLLASNFIFHSENAFEPIFLTLEYILSMPQALKNKIEVKINEQVSNSAKAVKIDCPFE